MSENENVQNPTNDDIIEDAATTEAEVSTSEDTSVNTELEAYKALYEKGQAELASAIEKNESLNRQIAILMRNGASVTSQSNSTSSPELTDFASTDNNSESDEPYVSLADLGGQVGKRNYKIENDKKR